MDNSKRRELCHFSDLYLTTKRVLFYNTPHEP